MKIIYGQIFKELRMNKKYTIKEISDSEVSSATISKFEHGAAMISTDKFFKIISNINVSPTEFISYVSEYLVRPYSFSELKDLFIDFQGYKINTVKLNKMIEVVEEQINEFPERVFLKLILISLKALISQGTSNHKYGVSTRELKTIRQFLLRSKRWTEFELWIYCNTIHLFDTKNLRFLSDRLISQRNYITITPDLEQKISMAIARLFYVLVSTDNIKNVNSKKYFDQLITYVEAHPISSKYTSEKALVKFCIGLYKYQNNEKSYGLQEIKKVIKALVILDCSELGDFLILEFKSRTGLNDI